MEVIPTILHGDTNTRIQNLHFASNCRTPVPRKDFVSGY